MLVNDTQQLIKTNFDSEAEIELVVQKYAEQLFGSSIIYLPQARISTAGGKGTIPDAIVIDVQLEEWFIVEAERAAHGTWEHIAPQISKQLAAVGFIETRELVLQLALNLIKSTQTLKDMFQEIGIGELEIHGRLQNILRKPPTIAIPIDNVPKDLMEWIQTLKNKTKVWVLEKYISTSTPDFVLYSLPDDNLPTISTNDLGENFSSAREPWLSPYQELLDAKLISESEVLSFDYSPRGGEKRTFQGIVRNDGIEVDDKTYSPSYAAVYCMQKSGNTRTTESGWKVWKNHSGKNFRDLYQQINKVDNRKSEFADS
ncbi:MAG: hypothetical protein QOC96_418 [Acidobacteriota bacterium]|jgi:hypothetical protein|nr:hypothetical protein [Acidobacteriota bacterium]